MGLLFGDGGTTIFSQMTIADNELATVVERWGGVEALLGFDEGQALFGNGNHNLLVLE